MTECERLINAGELDASFLEAETRCGYHVDSKMKKVWALQLDLVKQIEAVCQRHNLTYYIIGGALIGAIRHKGYIPWDDDIDVALKRDDYNVFVKKAQEELNEPYFLQTPVTDPSFYRPFVIIRNSNGTCISKGDQKLDCNNGICVHIFPLDGYEDNLSCRLFKFIAHVKRTCAMLTYNIKSAKDKLTYRRLMYFARVFILPFGIQRSFRKINEACTRRSAKYKGQIGTQYTHFDKMCWTWDASLFDEVINVPFEYTTLPIPKGYHEILTATYGDYMQFPPVEKRGNKHSFEFEPDVPYKEYCHQKYGVNYK